MTKLDCCPSCKKEIENESEAKPFCSKKCRDADLLGWLNEEYKVTRALNEDELDEFLSSQVGTLNPYDVDNF